MNEADVDDDKIIKYKDKEGESQEMTAGAAKKQPDNHPAKVAYNKMTDDGGDDKKDSGGKLGGSDFDRAADDDKGDKPKAEPKTKNKFGVDDDQFIGQTDWPHRDVTVKQALAYDGDNSTMKFYKKKAQGLMDDGDFEAYGIDPNHPKGGSPNAKAAEPKGDSDDANRAADDEADDMDRDARFDADSADEDDAEEISDSNSGPIDMDDILDMLKKDPDIVDKMGDDVYFDGEDLVSSKFDDDTIGSVRGNMTLGDLKKQIMDYEEEQDESIKVIDGKKYKAIKESKKNPRILKEIYDRTFRSLK